MLRYDRTAPFVLPSFLGILGNIRMQFFIGRLSGQQFISVPDPTSPSLEREVGRPGVAFADQPFIHGEKFSFKPTPNFEFSISRTVIFAGQGSPFNFRALRRSYFSVDTTGFDPGDRRAAFDLKYRVPGIRDWLTFYFDSFTDDEAFPLAYPKESVWNPGLFLARIPRLPKMDIRVEGLSVSAALHRARLLLLQLPLSQVAIPTIVSCCWQLDRQGSARCAGLDKLVVHAPEFTATQLPRYDRLARFPRRWKPA